MRLLLSQSMMKRIANRLKKSPVSSACDQELADGGETNLMNCSK